MMTTALTKTGSMSHQLMDMVVIIKIKEIKRRKKDKQIAAYSKTASYQYFTTAFTIQSMENLNTWKEN